MNLLFTFLKNLRAPERDKLNTINYRGTTGIFWNLIYKQGKQGIFDKEAILKATGVSAVHFDKMTSELLSKSYTLLFNGDAMALLNYLSRTLAEPKLFYNELNRYLKKLPPSITKDDEAAFYKQCFTMIHGNLPIMHRLPETSEKIASNYVALFKGKQRTEAEFFTASILLYEDMEVSFAAATIRANEALFKKAIDKLGQPLDWFNEETLFAYYLTHIYFYHALEKFDEAITVCQKAITALEPFTSEKNDINLVRIRLKLNEFLYYQSRFEESYTNYRKVMLSPLIDMLPDRPYHLTKYLQVCLITGHIDEAGKILIGKLDYMGNRVEELIIARDAVSFAKYYLFTGDYKEAFRFIQLGFAKNPKGKYFQYEIELRHLQTAYFVLTDQLDVAQELCARNIKYLRNHGYGVSRSDYGHFYILVKAIFEKNASGKFSKKHRQMLERHQLGSFAVYGKLLSKMLR